MKTICFTKTVAAGNDFVVIDARKSPPAKNIERLAKIMCHRRNCVGADGLLLVEKSDSADFKMRIFNPDGSEPSMCGNGARCISLYAYTHNIASKKMKFETRAGIIEAEVNPKTYSIKLRMSDPKNLLLHLHIKALGREIHGHFIDTGVPHTVYFVKDVEAEHIQEIGRAIRFHELFTPSGTNVNCVQIKNNNSIFVRTYERGVEDETYACGTGSVASAIIACLIHKLKSPIHVHTRGGAVLKVYCTIDPEHTSITKVFLEGITEEVFEGKMRYKE